MHLRAPSETRLGIRSEATPLSLWRVPVPNNCSAQCPMAGGGKAAFGAETQGAPINEYCAWETQPQLVTRRSTGQAAAGMKAVSSQAAMVAATADLPPWTARSSDSKPPLVHAEVTPWTRRKFPGVKPVVVAPATPPWAAPEAVAESIVEAAEAARSRAKSIIEAEAARSKADRLEQLRRKSLLSIGSSTADFDSNPFVAPTVTLTGVSNLSGGLHGTEDGKRVTYHFLVYWPPGVAALLSPRERERGWTDTAAPAGVEFTFTEQYSTALAKHNIAVRTAPWLFETVAFPPRAAWWASSTNKDPQMVLARGNALAQYYYICFERAAATEDPGARDVCHKLYGLPWPTTEEALSSGGCRGEELRPSSSAPSFIAAAGNSDAAVEGGAPFVLILNRPVLEGWLTVSGWELSTRNSNDVRTADKQAADATSSRVLFTITTAETDPFSGIQSYPGVDVRRDFAAFVALRRELLATQGIAVEWIVFPAVPSLWERQVTSAARLARELGAWLRTMLGVIQLVESEAMKAFCLDEIRAQLREKESHRH